MTRLAVIPARGGSKRIPGKNIRDFCGKPIIVWSIEAAIQSGCFDHVIVSTDSAEIAAVAKQHGATVPFMRPAALSDDHSGTIPVIRHATLWADEHYGPVESVCCIYATAPFVRPGDIQAGLEQLEATKADYIFSVTSFAFPIQRSVRIGRDGLVELIQPEFETARSQDLEEAYHDAGQFYWGTAHAWREGLPIMSGPNSGAYVLPRARVQDIDTPEDWDRAEAMFRALSASTKR